MRIGVVVHFFDFRNDVRQWIEALAKLHTLVLFVREEDEQAVRLMVSADMEIRLIKERKSSLWNRFWELAFRFLGKLPESLQNFYLMESFKISVINSPEKARKATRLLQFSMGLPRMLSYDGFIQNLDFKGQTDISEIDQFVFFTELSDNYFISRLIKTGKSPIVYVYSWDHPCKHLRFSKRLRYLVWHEGIRDDLHELQHIPKENIRIFGATQMGYVERWLQIKDQLVNPFPYPYVYFGCAIGVPPIVPDELKIVRKVAEVMAAVVPDWKLVVRPYPVMKDWSAYEALRTIPNLILDDGFRSKKSADISTGEDFIMEKFSKIHYSQAFFHLGTTLGIEASYTKAPSVLLDIKEFNEDGAILSLKNFIHQYQNDKYIHLTDFPNVVESLDELKACLSKLRDQPEIFQSYNQIVSSDIPPKSFKDLASEFSMLLTS